MGSTIVKIYSDGIRFDEHVPMENYVRSNFSLLFSTMMSTIYSVHIIWLVEV